MDAKPKVISVSKGRQITLPIQYYRELGINDEVECLLRDDEIVIRPVRRGDDFSEEILKDLIQQGYSGDELLAEFHRLRAGIRPAVKQMLDEAHQAAKDMNPSIAPEEQLAELFSDDSGEQGA
ncbi:AbrB/MazE/SpoVT family DNA-binding domain-containing protein [Alicyclobacillus fodiniaquatilis]|uniref:AbrB/MazE/SpoVT family DNA-binding domain-containing protein n=2 Tax=Alicyclobacillus fodiniaquatilis TaxID=1661150 RepID=A0ABW4JDJ9_9BACL